MKVESYWGHTFLPELIRSDGVIFDFGTYNGGFCKLVAPLCRRVIGFEPDPYWDGDGRLSLPENVLVLRKALAAKPGLVRFNLNEAKCSSMHYFDTGARSIVADAITLADAVALAQEERVELIKMDIEGEEVAVLHDASPEILQRVAQMTVEFHDFIDSTSTPAIRAVIKKMKGLGFLAIRFSWRTYGDFLFVNQQMEPLSLRQRAGLTVVHKYGRGFARIARRALRDLKGLAQ
jgi:FkbM family methyltransferase